MSSPHLTFKMKFQSSVKGPSQITQGIGIPTSNTRSRSSSSNKVTNKSNQNGTKKKNMPMNKPAQGLNQMQRLSRADIARINLSLPLIQKPRQQLQQLAEKKNNVKGQATVSGSAFSGPQIQNIYTRINPINVGASQTSTGTIISGQVLTNLMVKPKRTNQGSLGVPTKAMVHSTKEEMALNRRILSQSTEQSTARRGRKKAPLGMTLVDARKALSLMDAPIHIKTNVTKLIESPEIENIVTIRTLPNIVKETVAAREPVAGKSILAKGKIGNDATSMEALALIHDVIETAEKLKKIRFADEPIPTNSVRKSKRI